MICKHIMNAKVIISEFGAYPCGITLLSLVFDLDSQPLELWH